MAHPPLQLPEPDAGETGPYALIGNCRAKPGRADEVEALILALVGPLRSEAGALQFHVHRDRADRDLFVIYEAFDSLASLKQHIAQPYTQAFIRDCQPLVDGGLKQQFLRMCSAMPAEMPAVKPA